MVLYFVFNRPEIDRQLQRITAKPWFQLFMLGMWHMVSMLFMLGMWPMLA